jgi:ADP-ribosylglycohydrolase
MINNSNTVIERAQGCLVGLSLGDDNGGPTAMMLKNLEIMTQVRTVMPQYFGKGYLEWFKEEGYDAGLVTHKVLELVDSGLSFDDAAKQVDTELDGMTASISPAHRSIPLTLYFVAWYLRSPNFFEEFPNTGFREFESLISREARLTHLHKEASEVSIAVNAICMYLILGKDIIDSMRFGLKFINENLRLNIEDNISTRNSDNLKSGGYAPDVLTAALWFLLHTRSLKDALDQSKEFAGIANYCPVLVGSIGGAMYGYNEIKPYLKNISKDNIEQIALSIDSIFDRIDK